MIVNVNVLSMALLHSITGNEVGALVVTIDQDRSMLRRQQGATNKRYITLLCSLADANSAATLAQWYKW